MSATHFEKADLDTAEQIARIDQLLADRDQKLQSIKFFPWQLAIGLMTAGAGFFAAGAAFIKFLN